MAKGTPFGMDASGAAALGGYIAGISKTVSTKAYVDSALDFVHAVLADLFDRWMDTVAEGAPKTYQHVYEWPSEWHNYRETVGNPAFRLWNHQLTGKGRDKIATFSFLPSKRPSPVDPILLEEGPGGSVKEDVHIFHWKAPAMEYGWHITVTPKLSKYLAYVGRMSEQGYDDGWHHANEQEDGSMVNLSEGPVEFTAGGDVTNMAFTRAFILWWSTMASEEFDKHVVPRLQADVVNKEMLGRVVKQGNRKRSKKMSIVTSGDEQEWARAFELAKADLDKKRGRYIADARRRRLEIYGE